MHLCLAKASLRHFEALLFKAQGRKESLTSTHEIGELKVECLSVLRCGGNGMLPLDRGFSFFTCEVGMIPSS